MVWHIDVPVKTFRICLNQSTTFIILTVVWIIRNNPRFLGIYHDKELTFISNVFEDETHGFTYAFCDVYVLLSLDVIDNGGKVVGGALFNHFMTNSIKLLHRLVTIIGSHDKLSFLSNINRHCILI